MSTPTHAISLHAPWAWAVMFGGKDVENRGLRFPKRFVGERVWIHASMWPGSWSTLNSALWASGREKMHCLAADHLGCSVNEQELEFKLRRIRGHIIGSVEVVEYRTPENPPESAWYIPGSLGLVLRDPQPLATPRHAKGALGWWKVAS